MGWPRDSQRALATNICGNASEKKLHFWVLEQKQKALRISYRRAYKIKTTAMIIIYKPKGETTIDENGRYIVPEEGGCLLPPPPDDSVIKINSVRKEEIDEDLSVPYPFPFSFFKTTEKPL